MTESPGETLEPTDEQLRSQEAKRYRLERNAIRDQNAELIRQMVDTAAQRDAAQRQAIDAELRGKFADPQDFWSKTDLSQLRGEDGSIDIDQVRGHRDQLLTDHPHYMVKPIYGAATAETVGSAGLVGYGPRNLLDTENVEAGKGPRDWADFLQDAARGDLGPPATT